MAKVHNLLKRAAKKAHKAAKKLQRVADHALNAKPGAFVRLAQLPKDDRLARARMRGFNDVVKGRGFRDSYDRWKKAAQLAYERGRMEASLGKVEALRHGKVLDTWAMGERIQGPMYRACGPQMGEAIIQQMRETVRSVK